ncbi:MAG: hypothetical protein OXC95_01005 [Dehalococcoidia bacterium]|nr:hypothetical protein [Dehalococcoidia bacterium]
MQTNRTFSGRRIALLAIAGAFALAAGVVVVLVLLFPMNTIPRAGENPKDCSGRRYFDLSDRWDYKGASWSWEWYRDHDIIFHGNHVPVPSGTIIRTLSEHAIAWNYPEIDVRGNDVHMRLEGNDSALFAVEYHPNYQLTYNKWQGLHDVSAYSDDMHEIETALASNTCFGFCKAIWHIPDDRHQTHQFQANFKGHIITTVQELPEGEYEFDLHIEFDYGYGFDCGQGDPEPRKFRVIVDRDIPTVPPAPTDVQVSERDDGDGWMVSWQPVDGIENYTIQVRRAQVDEHLREENPGYGGILANQKADEPPHHLELADIWGECGNVLYLEMYALGDGTTYLRDFGGISETVRLHVPPSVD